MMSKKNVAIVLSAGRGKRMNSAVQKQYLLIKGKPVICYSLQAFQDCPFIDEIILVTGKDDIEYCRKDIVEKYGFTKVTVITPGGAERYISVYHGLQQIKEDGYVFIHDGARPFVDQQMLSRAMDAVKTYRACVVGMPVKDTIKISDRDGFAECTPERALVWQVQTPQVFETALAKECYEKLMQELQAGSQLFVTDDAMVVEHESAVKVRLVEGSYENIKITTPEDLKLAEIFLS